MSIINQALKKAQREQLLHESHAFPGGKQADTAGPSRPWFVMTAGLAVALGLGAVFHAWLSLHTGHRSGVDAAPEIVRPSTVVTPQPAPALQPVTPPTETVLVTPAPSPMPAPSPRPATVPETQPEHMTSVVTPLAPMPSRPSRAVSSFAASSLTATRQAAPTPTAESAEPAPRDRQQAQTLFNQALDAQASGALERTQTLLEQAVRLDPTLKVAYNSLGNLYYQQHQYPQAIAMYERALALDPQYAKARNNLGSTYLRLAMDDQARIELQQALQADSEYGLAYYNLACVYARAGDSTTAAQYLQQAITFEPQARMWAQTDDDFAPVRATPVVQKLLGP